MLQYIVNLETSFNEQQLKELTKPYLRMLSNEVYLITKQVRSCAWIDFPEEIIPYMEDALIKLIQLEKLQYYVLPFDIMQNNVLYNILQLFIYKYNWQKQLFIKHINERNTLTAEFIFGKLLGYSDESINQYLLNRREEMHV